MKHIQTLKLYLEHKQKTYLHGIKRESHLKLCKVLYLMQDIAQLHEKKTFRRRGIT